MIEASWIVQLPTLWVFIANNLAVDGGGIHMPAGGTANINDLGLIDGKIYEVAVFQANRQTNGSSFRLTLNGLSATTSECRFE